MAAQRTAGISGKRRTDWASCWTRSRKAGTNARESESRLEGGNEAKSGKKDAAKWKTAVFSDV